MSEIQIVPGNIEFLYNPDYDVYVKLYIYFDFMRGKDANTKYKFIIQNDLSDKTIFTEIVCNTITPSVNPEFYLKYGNLDYPCNQVIFTSTLGTINITSNISPFVIISGIMSNIEYIQYDNVKYYYEQYLTYLSEESYNIIGDEIWCYDSDLSPIQTLYGYVQLYEGSFNLIPFKKENTLILQAINVMPSLITEIKDARVIINGDCQIQGTLKCTSLTIQ